MNVKEPADAGAAAPRKETRIWNAAIDAATNAIGDLPTSATVWTGEPLLRRSEVLVTLLMVRRLVESAQPSPARRPVPDSSQPTPTEGGPQ